MKQLTLKLVLPLTVISFATFTKWWYTLPVDAPDTTLSGFPLPFLATGWHTSLSLQIFIVELIFDILTYFAFWFILTYIFNRYIKKIRILKAVTFLLAGIAGLTVVFAILIASNQDNLFYIKRPWDMEVIATGYKFIWQKKPQSDFYRYPPERHTK